MAHDKKSVNYLKLFFLGVIWSFAYLEMTSIACTYLFNFNPLLWSDWVRLVDDFFQSKWVIDTALDFSLFMVVFLYVPFWVFGWVSLYNCNWKKFFSHFKVHHKIIRKKIKISTAKKVYVPDKMRVQSSALLSVSPVQNSNSSSDSLDETDFANLGISGYNEDEVNKIKETFGDEDEVVQVLQLTANIAADFFPHISMNGEYASFAMSTDTKAIVVLLVNQPGSTWVVDTETDIMESDWYCESRIFRKPAKGIISISKSLQEDDPNALTHPVIVMMSGTLINPIETMDYLDQNGVTLLRLKEADVDEVPLFTDFLTEYFGVKTEEVSENSSFDTIG